MTTPQFYPALSSLTTPELIPEPIRSVVAGIFDKLFYKSYYVEKSLHGDQAYVHMVLVFKEVGFNIFGGSDGFEIVFNPGEVPGTTELPVALYYNLPILRYTKNISLTDLGTLDDYFKLFLEMFNLSEEDLLYEVVNVFFSGSENPVQDLVDSFNNNPDYASFPPLVMPEIDPDNLYTAVLDIAGQLKQNSINISNFVFVVFLQTEDLIEGITNLSGLLRRWAGEITMEKVLKLFIPKFSATIQATSLALTIPRTWLQPIDINGNVITDPLQKSMLKYNVGSVTYDSETGFDFNSADSFTLTPSQIANTGLIIEITNVEFDFKKDKNIAQADADGRASDFTGFFAESASITLPKNLFKNQDNPGSTLKLKGSNLLIGTGGVSGTVALETITPGGTIGQNDYLKINLGSENGFAVGFNKFDITFRQNAVVGSNIKGLLEIPRLKPAGNSNEPFKIWLDGHLDENGGFNLTATFQEEIKARFGDYLEIKFLSVGLGKEDGGKFYIEAAVELSFPTGIMHTISKGQKIRLPQIRLYSDGSFEIIGGFGVLPTSFSLHLGPVDMSVTNINFGSIQKKLGQNERKYNFIAFDGAISVNPFGVDAKGKGVTYYYTTDDDEFGGGDAYLHLQTIEIDMVVPHKAPTITIHGMLSIPEPGISQEYRGNVTFSSSETALSGSADMKLIPKYPAFLVDAAVSLPKPIPLGSVSIYGFRALIGQRYVPSKTVIGLPETATWYEYYKKPKKGINVEKFAGPEDTTDFGNPFSFGAGIVIGSSLGNGKIFSIRAMLLLSLPNLLMIEGRASILEKRPGLVDASEPPFYAMVAWSPTSFEVAAGANYQLPKSNGDLFKIDAEVQAAFFKNNPSLWYVNFGNKDKMISVYILKRIIGFRAQGFLMLSAQGMEAGAFVNFSLKKNFFGIRIKIGAYIEVGAHVSFERTQFGGYVSAAGQIEVNFWRAIYIKFRLKAILSAEAVKPYLVTAELKFRWSIRLGFFRISFKITLKLRWEFNNSVDTTPLPPLPYMATLDEGMVNRAKELVKGTHMLTNETFQLTFLGASSVDNPVNLSEIKDIIPLDTFIDIKIIKGLNPSMVSNIGGYTSGANEFIEMIPPKKVVKGGKVLRTVKHSYKIENLSIFAYNGSSWMPYHPYAAAVPAGPERNLVSQFKVGYWQRSGNTYNSLRILANNPLSYLDAGEPGWVIPEQYGMTPSNFFCSTVVNDWGSWNVMNKPLGTNYPYPLQFDSYNINGTYFAVTREFEVPALDSMKVNNPVNPFGIAKSLVFSNYNELVITLSEDCLQTKLYITTQSSSVKISYYKTDPDSTSSTPQYVEVFNEIKTQEELQTEVFFNEFGEYDSIIRIVITPLTPQNDEINSILAQIAALYTESYSDASGEVTITMPGGAEYVALLNQLVALVPLGCASGINYGEEDEVLCDLYNTLNNLSCFGNVATVAELNMACYGVFDSTFEQWLDDHFDTYYALLHDYWKFYNRDFTNLQQAILNELTEEEILAIYNQLWESAVSALEFIRIAGNCNCGDDCSENCTTSIQQIEWKTMSQWEYEGTIPGQDAVDNEVHLMQQAISHNPQPIWRPNTNYYISFKLTDTVNEVLAPQGNFIYKYGFKTAGTIGHFHNSVGVKYGNEYDASQNIINRKNDQGQLNLNGKLTNPDSYTLTSLRSYIDYKRSYPNADGDVIMAKPVYYSNEQCRINLFFSKPFSYNLLNGWPAYGLGTAMTQLQGKLNIMIKDPVIDTLIPYPLPIDEEVLPAPDPTQGNPWVADAEPQANVSVMIFNNYIQNGVTTCGIIPGSPIAPISYYYSVVLINLKPQKAYTAIIFNAAQNSSGNVVNNEVHRFLFQTSRYSTFHEHIRSFAITESKNALFELKGVFSPDSVNLINQVILGNLTNPELDQGYADPIDRIIEGIYKFKPLEPALTTEVNLIRNQSNNNINSLLIRSAEPFINPRMPKSVIDSTFAVLNQLDQVDTNFKFIFSKDCSQIVVVGNAPITGPLKFRFTYKNWDGTDYTSSGIAPETIDINI